MIVLSQVCENAKVDSGPSYINQESVVINDCIFERYSLWSSDGGVVFMAHNSISIISISRTLFVNCSAINGGALYCDVCNSSQRFVCAKQCSSSNSCHYFYIRSKDSMIFYYLSVSECSLNINKPQSCSTYMGKQAFECSNMSKNHVSYTSSLYSNGASSFICSFCCFSNNIAMEYNCICFESSTGIMNNANFVRNNSPFGFGTFILKEQSNINISSSVCSENSGTLAFSDPSSNLFISNCSISHDSLISNGTIIIMNIQSTSFETLRITLFMTQYCYADIPYVLDSTPPRSYDIQCYNSYTNNLVKGSNAFVVFSILLNY